MALSRDIVIRLLGDADSAVKAQKAAADAAGVSAAAYRRAEREFDKQTKAAELAAAKQKAAMEKLGRGATLMGVAVAAGLGLAAKAAIDWESAWAGVVKTVGGTPAQLRQLEGSLRDLATQLPATHEEIAGVAEAAGQLGIARTDIVEFTKVAIAMGVSTNLSADDAATGLARLSNIMGTASSDVDRMGSSLVALGNAGASTESEILDMSLRIAAAGRQAGFSEGEVMGLANAMSSLGIEAEAGGTAISMVIKNIGNAVMDGGEDLEAYAKIAGTSAQAFAKAWREDAASALVTVVQGLGRMQQQGENVNQVIDDLGLGGIRTSDTLLRLSGDAQGLADSLALGNKAWAENDALMNEANKRYETTAARLQIARNQIKDAAIDIGGLLLPALATGAELVADFARGFEQLPGPVKTIVTVLGVAAATIGVLGGAAIIAVPKIAAFRVAMQSLAGSSSAAAAGLGRFGLFMTGPWGAALGIATVALGGLIAALGASSRASEEAASYQRDLASALRESGGAIDDNVRALAAKQAEETKVGNSTLLQWAQKLGIELPRVTDALLGNRDAYEEITGAIDDQIAALDERASHIQGAGGSEAQQIQNQMSRYQQLKSTLEELANSMGGAVAENQRLAAAQEESGETAAGSVPGVDSATAAAQRLEEQSGRTAEEVEEWLSSLQRIGDAFVEPLQTYEDLLSQKQEAERESAQATAAATEDSSDSWRDYVSDVSLSLDEYATKLEEQLTAQENWRRNIGLIAQRGGVEVAQILAQMGEDGAQLVQQMVDANDADFQRLRDLMIRDAREGGQGAAAQMDTAMQVMAQIGADGAKATVQGIAAELGIGADTVRDIAASYGVHLAEGINPVLKALGKTAIQTGDFVARSGVVVRRADGGFAEDHSAQIAPAGAWRVWAEPETGGEAYIPLHPSKRGRSVNIWRETGRRLGMPQFAVGGFWDPDQVPHPPSTVPFGPPISTAADAAMQHEYDAVVDFIRSNALLGGLFGASAASPNGVGGLGPMAAAARAFVMATWGLTNIGGYSYRNIAGTGVLSDHALGKAIDVMIPNYMSAASIALGNSIASWFVTHPSAYGTKYVIWRDQINSGRGWEPYSHPGGGTSDTLQHRDHVHVSFYKDGGLRTPVYHDGIAYVPQTGWAYLEKGERVIPAALNQRAASSGIPVGSGGGAVTVRLDYQKLAAAVGQRALIGQLHQTLVSSSPRAAFEELEHGLRVAELGGRY